MNAAAHTVVAITASARVIINYDTGNTEMRRLNGQPVTGTIVHIRPSAPTWGTTEARATLTPNGYTPLHWRLAAIPAVLLTAAVRACGPRRRRFRRLVQLARSGRHFVPATRIQAEYAVRAVRRASYAMPTAWACLEESVAATALLALAGRRAEWRHGLATDPVRLHAWLVDARGRPVEEPEDTLLYTATYTPDGPGPACRARRENAT
ncbi:MULTISPECIES: lasso peptide biosynthesis B2 protein [unclassified Streptomyces]|uniref:lasso peptide biosynthesis B2 protein n=1 Tax=unclassified Streptomyces TaxID=2593676 RepID=UPI000376EE3D|nr:MULTISPECIES: lasso peptide biosynthesis B2 protein [unclassified Streptomyces]MYT34393.1 lasso peptide biosynthesis B2 protein [Streptomyces sp. SID8354]